MKNLTNEQILSVLSLTEKRPELFKAASIMTSSFGYSLDIHAVENTSLHQFLYDIYLIFPGIEYDTMDEFDHDDGTYCEHHRFKDGLTLYINKAPGQEETPSADTESEKEITPLNYTTEEEVRAIV